MNFDPNRPQKQHKVSRGPAGHVSSTYSDLGVPSKDSNQAGLSPEEFDIQRVKFQDHIGLKSYKPILLSPTIPIVIDWDGDYAAHRIGLLELGVGIHRNCKDHDTLAALSPAQPAFFLPSYDHKSYQVFLHESIPPEILDAVLFHELIEAQSFFHYNLKIDYCHGFAVCLTDEYVKANYNPARQEKYREFEAKIESLKPKT